MAFIDDICPANELQRIYIDAWNREIFFYPFTLSDLDYVKRMSKGNDGEFIAYYLIRKCLNEKGEPCFSVGDKQKLMRSFPSETLADIVSKMRGEATDAAKN